MKAAATTVQEHHKSIQQSIVRLSQERDAAKAELAAKQLEIESKESQLAVLLKALEQLETPFTVEKPKRTAKKRKLKRHKANGRRKAQPTISARNDKVYHAILKAGGDGIGLLSLVDRTGLDKDEVAHAVHALKFTHKKVRTVQRGIFAAVEA